RANHQTPPKYRVLRTRTILYTVLISGIGALIVWGLATKATIEANVLKDRSPPYVQLSNGDIQNGYTLKLVNKLSEPRTMVISITGIEGLSYNVIGFDHESAAPLELPVEAHGVDRYRVLVTAPAGASQRQITISVRDAISGETDSNRASFRGPNP
ncbi:MAG: FixG Ig-like domain-containing protein, partial [Pseudomonadota bacterium]